MKSNLLCSRFVNANSGRSPKCLFSESRLIPKIYRRKRSEKSRSCIEIDSRNLSIVFSQMDREAKILPGYEKSVERSCY